jgi:hypothetical protein
MEHYAIEKFKHMHSCVNPIRPSPRQRQLLVRRLYSAFATVAPDGTQDWYPQRGLFPHPLVKEKPVSPPSSLLVDVGVSDLSM